MISSQDGTEDRRPRAAFRPWRAVCSPTASAGADGADGAVSAGGAAETAGTTGETAAAESPAADGAGASCRA